MWGGPPLHMHNHIPRKSRFMNMYECKYPHLFEPIRVGSRTFRNRIFNSPTGTHYRTINGLPTDDAIAYYERKAIGGAAAVNIGDACVDSELSFHASTHIALDDWYGGKAYMTKAAEAINRHGAVATIELVHGGGCATGSYQAGHTIYGPVDMESFARGKLTVAKEMPPEIIQRTIDKFYEAALTAKRWGFGMITIHGGHGWLLSQFMSPAINKRTDEWGGSFENRMRLPLAIVDACRRAVGPGFPIELRISGSEIYDGGYDIDYGIRVAEAFDGKVDIIHVSAGSHENDDTFTITHPSMFLEDGCNVKYAAAIKPHIKYSKVATVGALSDPEMLEEIIASGQADIVQMARGLICDPDLPIKARTGRDDEIRHCMRCFACFGGLLERGHIGCAQNPEITNELEFKYAPQTALHKKSVLVAGGGVAGMQAAITCAQQGHKVELYEKSAELGGILRCEKKVPFKAKLEEYLDYQAKLCAKVGVEIHLGEEVTPELVRSREPDVVIAALGATPSMPPIPGIDGKNVVEVSECYRAPEKTGQNVAILGGGLSGTELSIYLNKYLGRNCTLIEFLPQLNNGGNPIHGMAINTELKNSTIDVRTGTKCVRIAPDGVWCEKDGKEEFVPADTVVVALGMRSRADLAAALSQTAPEFYLIGDCNTPRNVFFSTDEAYHVAMDIGRL